MNNTHNPFDLPIRRSPLRTRRDVEEALLRLLAPVESRFTPGDAGLCLGAFQAHYGAAAAQMEGFSRMLWGLAPPSGSTAGRTAGSPGSAGGWSTAATPPTPPTGGRWPTATRGSWRWRPSPSP